MNKVIALVLVACSNCFSMQLPDFRDDLIAYSDCQVTLTLPNHQCKIANFYMGNSINMSVVQTSIAHSYNGYETLVTFSANIHDKNLQAGMARILGVDPLKAPYSALTFMGYLIYGNEMCAEKPQHEFCGEYAGGDTWAIVKTKCKVYTTGGGTNDFNWEECKVNFHPDINGATLISGDTHHLGFTKDGKTRIVLHHSQYSQGQLAGQSRIGMLVLYGDDCVGKELSDALKINSSFTGVWNVIATRFPEFSAALELPELTKQNMPLTQSSQAIESSCRISVTKKRSYRIYDTVAAKSDRRQCAYHSLEAGKNC